MRLRQDHSLFRLITILFFSLLAWSMALTAHAAKPAQSASKNVKDKIREYEVRNGDTLGAIAIEYGVPLEDLMTLNDIKEADKVWAGRKLQLPKGAKPKKKSPKGVTIEVPRGFNLTKIAAAYEIQVATLIAANQLSNPDRLREGQKLYIPGAPKIIELVPPPPCFKDAVTFYRVRSDETKSVPLSFCSGKTNPAGLEELSRIAAPPKKAMPFPLHPRLARLLQRVAEKYPGKRFEIISGQRLPKQKGNESYHNTGRAIDFRVEGISNKSLSQYVRTFSNVGVGYYPNSVFIHLDTRDTKAYWVDYSRPGEKAIYARSGMTRKAIDRIRKKRQRKQHDRINKEVRANVTNLIQSLAMNTPTKPQG